MRELVNEVVCNAPLAFEPGTSYLYGLNTDVLGYIIEIISGQSLDVFFEEVIHLLQYARIHPLTHYLHRKYLNH